jgi:hypothetical protein
MDLFDRSLVLTAPKEDGTTDGASYSAQNLPRKGVQMTRFSAHMAFRLLTDMNRRFPSPTLDQIVAMLLDPRTARGMVGDAIDKDGFDSIGLCNEERKRGMLFLISAIDEVNMAEESVAIAKAVAEELESNSDSDSNDDATTTGMGGVEIRQEPQEASSANDTTDDWQSGGTDLFAQFAFTGEESVESSPAKKRRVAPVSGNAPQATKQVEKIDELKQYFEVYVKQFDPDRCVRVGSEKMRGTKDLRQNPLTTLRHTDVKGFFEKVIKPALPAVYRVSLKYLRTMASSSFQERVFSAAKRTMTLQRTSLGAELFGALVVLRHNSAHLRSWMVAEEVEAEEVFAAAAKIVQSAVEADDEAALAKAMQEEMAEALGVVQRNGGLTWDKAKEVEGGGGGVGVV